MIARAAAQIADEVDRLAADAGVPPSDLLDLARRIRLRRLARAGGLVVLRLPEPPSQRGRKGWRTDWTKTRSAKRDVWRAAVAQVEPFERPPRRVRVHAWFRLWNLRDPLNLVHDLKPVVDALEVPAPGSADSLEWRQSPGGVHLYPGRGYFVDDADAEIGLVEQEIDRSNRGVTLFIEPLDPTHRENAR